MMKGTVPVLINKRGYIMNGYRVPYSVFYRLIRRLLIAEVMRGA